VGKSEAKTRDIKEGGFVVKDRFDQTAWHRAACRSHIELLEKLWELAKEINLKPEELRNEMLSKTSSIERPDT